MKTAKTFRFSDEAIKILNEQDNATEFLESLILDMYQRPLEVVPLQQLKDFLEALGPPNDISRGQPNGTPPENITDTFDQFLITYGDPSQKKPPHPVYGYPCCHKEPKCRHWQFNQDQAEYINSLTGDTEEAPAF